VYNLPPSFCYICSFEEGGQDRRKKVPLGLLHFFTQFSANHTLLSAGLVIGIVPLLIVYIFLQRYLVSGLLGTAVKG
jgi:ABC-type glycerol-3-phosphate transport system permease component